MQNDNLKFKILKFVVLIFLVFCLFPFNGFQIQFGQAYGPTIQSVTGTLNHGNAVTITGVGFGSDLNSVMLFDDFEAGTNGNNLNASPKAGAWTLNSQPTPQYSTVHYHSGSKCSYGEKAPGAGNIYTQMQISDSGVLADTYYFASWWGKYHNPCSTIGQVKMIQLWGTYQVGDYNPGVFWGEGAPAYIALENSGSTEAVWTEIPSEEVWHNIQLELKQSDVNTANGIVKLYVNGDLIYNKVNVKTRERTGESWEKLIPWEGMTNQSGCTDNRYLALDDIYLNNTWARVVVGNNSTYATCTKFDICPVSTQLIPSAGWADGSITCYFNSGDYANGTHVYLYVVDSNGAVNSSGYPITIGSGSQPDTTPPAAPTGVMVS
jgi:hypothetical protein